MAHDFVRRLEDFTCLSCGQAVIGNGYTNHCPKCLWSRHVDVDPGDRAEACRGMMCPVNIIKKGKNLAVVHVCQLCGEERSTKVVPEDEIGDFLSSMI